MGTETERQYLKVLNAKEFPVRELTDASPPAEQAPVSREQQLERLRKTVARQPLHREILYKILVRAEDFCTLRQLEDYVAMLPQFAEATEPQYELIQYLVRAGGIDEYELDAQGAIVQEQRKAGLSEDELDDLVCTWGYRTSALGRQVAQEMRPARRLDSLLSEHPEWAEALLDTLGFLDEKRELGEVGDFLKTLCLTAPDGAMLQPGVFVDKLEKAGVIVWQDGWVISEDGRQCLAGWPSAS